MSVEQPPLLSQEERQALQDDLMKTATDLMKDKVSPEEFKSLVDQEGTDHPLAVGRKFLSRIGRIWERDQKSGLDPDHRRLREDLTILDRLSAGIRVTEEEAQRALNLSPAVLVKSVDLSGMRLPRVDLAHIHTGLLTLEDTEITGSLTAICLKSSMLNLKGAKMRTLAIDASTLGDLLLDGIEAQEIFMQGNDVRRLSLRSPDSLKKEPPPIELVGLSNNRIGYLQCSRGSTPILKRLEVVIPDSNIIGGKQCGGREFEEVLQMSLRYTNSPASTGVAYEHDAPITRVKSGWWSRLFNR